jgi:hypothetical protein
LPLPALPTTPRKWKQCLKDAKAKGLTGEGAQVGQKSCKDAYNKAKVTAMSG